jgi:hypothetical protein
MTQRLAAIHDLRTILLWFTIATIIFAAGYASNRPPRRPKSSDWLEELRRRGVL